MVSVLFSVFPGQTHSFPLLEVYSKPFQIHISSPDFLHQTANSKICLLGFLYLKQTPQIPYYSLNAIFIRKAKKHKQTLLFLSQRWVILNSSSFPSSQCLSKYLCSWSPYLYSTSSFTCLNHLFSKDLLDSSLGFPHSCPTFLPA